MNSNLAVFEKTIAESNMYDYIIGHYTVITLPFETTKA